MSTINERRAAALPQALARAERGAEAKHTPEPWEVGEADSSGWCIKTAYQVWPTRLDGQRDKRVKSPSSLYPVFGVFPALLKREDADRIVACVNACAPGGAVAKLAEAAEAALQFCENRGGTVTCDNLEAALAAVRELLARKE